MIPSTSDVAFPTLAHRSASRAPSAVERWLRGCWESEPGLAAGTGGIDVTFLASAPWQAMPPPECAEVTALDGATLTWLRHGARRWSTHRGRAGVELQLVGDQARIQAWHGARFGSLRFDAERAPWMMLALHVAICEAVRARGFAPLHAAVLARDGQATALLGRSGVGKSTALLSAVESGWLPIAEDFAWLDPATRQVYAWAGERGVRLDEEGRRRLPDRWQQAAWRHAGDGKLVLAFDKITPCRPSAATLTRVVVLHRNPSRDSELEPLTPRDATRALWESAGVPLCRQSRDVFAAHVPRLVSELEWTRLVLGRTPPVL
jgi:hypothetical protein